jgi:hypothetical protein
VFSSPDRLARLNALVHPPVVRREEESDRRVRRAASRDGIAVVEAAILIETGSYKRFRPASILVVCAEEQQVERALRREGAVEADVRARIAARCRSTRNESSPISSSIHPGQGGHACGRPGPSTKHYGESNHESFATISLGRRAGGRIPVRHFGGALDLGRVPAGAFRSGALWSEPASAAARLDFRPTSRTISTFTRMPATPP